MATAIQQYLYPILPQLTITCLILSSCSGPATYPSVPESSGQTDVLMLENHEPEPVLIYMALSGGGLRAAAFSYGVIDELQRIGTASVGGSPNIMEHVSYISGVSGGAFPAAYFAMLREPLKDFRGFEDSVLRKDHESAIAWKVLLANPFDVYGRLRRRSEIAGEYFDKLFGRKTFSDLPSRTFLIINATDLVLGRRFTFTGEQFKCLGLPLTMFPIGLAIAASASFPVAFSTINIPNQLHAPTQCFTKNDFELLSANQATKVPAPFNDSAKDSAKASGFTDLVARQRYLDKKDTAFLHLADGGLTDNLGIEALKDLSPVIARGISNGTVRAIVIIAVNAATPYYNSFGAQSESPLFWEVLSAQADMFLKSVGKSAQENTVEFIDDLRVKIKKMGKQIPIHCLNFAFSDIEEERFRSALYSVPTRLSLSKEDTDTLIAAGRFLVNKNFAVVKQIQDLIAKPTMDLKTLPSSCTLKF